MIRKALAPLNLSCLSEQPSPSAIAWQPLEGDGNGLIERWTLMAGAPRESISAFKA
jgi:hypothetical protein